MGTKDILHVIFFEIWLIERRKRMNEKEEHKSKLSLTSKSVINGKKIAERYRDKSEISEAVQG